MADIRSEFMTDRFFIIKIKQQVKVKMCLFYNMNSADLKKKLLSQLLKLIKKLEPQTVRGYFLVHYSFHFMNLSFNTIYIMLQQVFIGH